MNLRKIDLMHHLFGKSEQNKCRDCSNLVCGRYHTKTLRKCRVYGLTHSEASDWTLKYTACGMFNKEYSGHPIINLVKHNSCKIKMPEEPLEGQVEMLPLLFAGMEEIIDATD